MRLRIKLLLLLLLLLNHKGDIKNKKKSITSPQWQKKKKREKNLISTNRQVCLPLKLDSQPSIACEWMVFVRVSKEVRN